MTKVSATAIYKEWGRYSEAAQREPVAITSHGRESLVLLSASEYYRLKSLDTQRAMSVAELSDAHLDLLAKVEPADEAKAFDDEL